MKGCPDCEREQKRIYEIQLADMQWFEREREAKDREEIKRQQEALSKLEQAIDYNNIRKNMTFTQKLKELFK